jgi:outer membrane protein TolC
MNRFMTYLLYPRHRATFTLALAIVLISHTLNATSGTYTEGIYGLNNEVAQDTVFLEYEEFIDRALEQIGQLQAAQVSVSLAQNQVQQVRNQRFLPSLRMESEHGILPSVISPRGFPNNQIYLDPDATYDWDNWDFANRFRVIGVQPLFIWGAVDKAVKAAQFGVQSIEQQATATKQEIELQLHGLYFGYQLALEIERLLDVAIETMNTVERSINQQRKDSPDEINESEIYKFKVFQAQFKAREDEVKQNLLYVTESWNYILGNKDAVYLPANMYLKAPSASISTLDYYQQMALMNRSEIQALSYAEKGARMFIEAKKAENKPGLFLGFRGTYAHAPSRPRQDNPFISSDGNTLNMSFGFSIRQNLNFNQIKTNLKRAELEMDRLDFQQKAIQDKVMLEVHEKYRDAAIAQSKYEGSIEALKITKEWLRMEQLDYDFGIGDVRDVVDALKQELELRIEEKQTVFDYIISLANLNKATGLSINQQND